MDAQCNEIQPEVAESPEPDWADEMARHKAMTAEVRQKVDEAQQKAAAAEAQERAEAQKRAEAHRQAEEAKRAEEARKLAEEARRKLQEEELAAKEAEELAAKRAEEEELAAKKQAEDEALAKAREMQAAEAAAMDKYCVECFLKCTENRIKTPLKGSNLYTKHMRPCRAPGTSVDVKDSSFYNLGNFLQFLEREGLLRLEPGLTDPVVTRIHYGACRDYIYSPESRSESGASPAKTPLSGKVTSLGKPPQCSFEWQ